METAFPLVSSFFNVVSISSTPDDVQHVSDVFQPNQLLWKYYSGLWKD